MASFVSYILIILSALKFKSFPMRRKSMNIDSHKDSSSSDLNTGGFTDQYLKHLVLFANLYKSIINLCTLIAKFFS